MKASVLIWFLLALAPQVMTATPILADGDFESTSGDLFTTYYAPYDSSVHFRLWYGEAAVSNNPNSIHDLYSSFGDHTTGHGKMLVVNGAPDPDTAFWEGELESPLTPGSQYAFSFWAASTYPVNAAVLKLSVDGVDIRDGMIPLLTAGQWTNFTTFFTPLSASPTIRLSDSSTLWEGNDFAVDDLSIFAVPEPATWMLLAGGSILAAFRRRR